MVSHHLLEAGGGGEVDVFLEDVAGLDVAAETLEQGATDFGDEVFWGAGSGGDQDGGAWIFEPGEVDLAGVVDESPWGAGVGADLGEAFAVAAVGGADDQGEVAHGCEGADGVLSIGGGVADVFGGRALDLGEGLLECLDDDTGVVGAEGGLGEVDQLGGVVDAEVGDVGGRLDDLGGVGGLAAGADDLLVVFMADEEDLVSEPGVADGLVVDFGDEGAGGVDDAEVALLGSLADGGGDAMGAEDDDGALGHEVDVFNEEDATFFESADHVVVVDDVVVDVDGLSRAEVQHLIDDVDGHAHACAEAPWIWKDQLHGPW